MAGWKTKNNNSSTTGSEIWRNAGSSESPLQVSMFKKWQNMMCVSHHCVSLRTFWTPLVHFQVTGEHLAKFGWLVFDDLRVKTRQTVTATVGQNVPRHLSRLSAKIYQILGECLCRERHHLEFNCCFRLSTYGHLSTSTVLVLVFTV